MVKNRERKEGEERYPFTRSRLKFGLAIFFTFFSLLATLYVNEFLHYIPEDMPSYFRLFFVLGLFFVFFWFVLFEWIDRSRRKEGVQGKKKKLLEKPEK